MEDEARAERANIVGFDTERDERFPWIVDTTAKLKGKAVDARG